MVILIMLKEYLMEKNNTPFKYNRELAREAQALSVKARARNNEARN